jgi:hypothetical protein
MRTALRNFAMKLHELANDVQLSIEIFNKPEMKRTLVFEILQAEIMISLLEKNKYVTTEMVDAEFKQCIDFMALYYNRHCYPAHETHFHTSFYFYVICPYTCLEEIADCIDKSLKGD